MVHGNYIDDGLDQTVNLDGLVERITWNQKKWPIHNMLYNFM